MSVSNEKQGSSSSNSMLIFSVSFSPFLIYLCVLYTPSPNMYIYTYVDIYTYTHFFIELLFYICSVILISFKGLCHTYILRFCEIIAYNKILYLKSGSVSLSVVF